jgi:poly(3-hydroxybutyrate) depolymerase
MRSRSIRRGSALLLAAALIVGACSGDSGDDVGTDTVDESSDESTTTIAGAADGEPVPSPGCGASEAVAGVEQEVTLDIEGQSRRYLVTTPSAHDGETPLPLVLDFHGLMEGAEIHAGMSQYSPVAEEEGFVVAFPHGSGDPVRWDAEPGTDPNLDLVYFDTMVEQLGNDLCLDESRVYATGLSYGAIFTSRLLCERAEVLAAAAPVAGIADPEGCDPSQPVPILTFHGKEDPILLFNGGVNTTAIPDRRQALAELQVPVLCLAGGDDRSAPPAVMEQMASRIAQAEYLCLPGVGHLMHMEAPQQVHPALLAFLQSKL